MARNQLRVLTVLFVALLIVLVLPLAAQACPTCKQALAANSGSQGQIVRGYFWSILFMMGMPFTLLGTFSGYMYLQVRRARAAQAQQPMLSRTALPQGSASRDNSGSPGA